MGIKYEQFTKDFLQRPLHFTAVEELEASMRRAGLISHQLHQLGAGPWQSDWAALEKDGIKLTSGRYGNAFSMPLHPPEGRVGLLFATTAGDPLLASGKDIANNALHFIPKGQATDIITPRLSGGEGITLSEDRFFEIANVIAPEMGPIEEVTSFERDTSQLNALRQATMEIIAHPQWNSADERLHNLVAATIVWMADAKTTCIGTMVIRTAIAKRAQEYLETHYRQSVRLEDLCRFTGVGTRTLQRCFHGYFNLTITEYLKSVRLNSARRTLVTGRDEGLSVARVALEHGFGHLGRFSVDFKNRFGESPGQTLGLRPPQAAPM